MIALAAQAIPWAEQPCVECKTKRPITAMVPVLSETRVLLAWRCNGKCVQ